MEPKPLFTGKNPSYQDENGAPRLINHGEYKDKKPSPDELKEWGEYPYGIGSLGTKLKRFIDFDLKRFDNNKENFEAAFWTWYKENPELEGARIDTTPSGGYHVWVEFAVPPKFTNFAIKEGGFHVGELIGYGRFCVQAPTPGYEILQDGGFAKVESAESIGLYPRKAKPEQSKIEGHSQPLAPPPKKSVAKKTKSAPRVIELEELLNRKLLPILAGQRISGDGSNDLITVYKEACGWSIWCAHYGVAITKTPEEIAHTCGVALGIEESRVERIIEKDKDNTGLRPACVYHGGNEAAWKRVYKLEPAYKKPAGEAGNAGELPLTPTVEARYPILVEAGSVDKIAREVLSLLATNPDCRQWIYCQGNSDGLYLSRIIRAQKDERGHYVATEKDIDTTDVLGVESLQCELNQQFAFFREKLNPSSGEVEDVPIDCPAGLAKHILNMGAWPGVPRLTGVVHHPILLKGGVMITRPGYDPRSGLLAQFDPSKFPAMPENPTTEDAEVALDYLSDWLEEFPFQQPIHKAGAIAMILTGVARKTLETAPLFGISATKRGTGKGTLAKIVGILI